MIKVNEIPNSYEPRNKILSKLEAYFKGAKGSVLMTNSQSAFLCGLLETYRPKKILEIGVAAGGSTAIILQPLEDIASPYEMHSVDICEKHWEHKEKNIGFLAEIAKENNLFTPPVNLMR
ncbi:MAG: hypothetical protein IKG61_06805 [Selenomonadaceae bacterium]|nr:hypothetical protein [Selenomonadaceae bacterium]MBR6712306.1 hypothetical protein [Selenomonadaceae bacterium]